MCGIIGAVAERNVVPILIEGLRRLEYRGYDSAGVAVLDADQRLERVRAMGKVKMLEASIAQQHTQGVTGIAHTRWATHGVPSEDNAHPHASNDVIAVVHNGIIENHDKLRKKLQGLGYIFTSQTDTEVVAHHQRGRPQPHHRRPQGQPVGGGCGHRRTFYRLRRHGLGAGDPSSDLSGRR